MDTGLICDQLSVPVYRVLAGPVLQAMAYETIIQNRAIYRIEPAPIVVVAFLLAMLLGPLYDRWSWRVGLGIMVGVTSVSGIVSVATLWAWPIIVDTVPWILVTVLSYTRGLWRAIDNQTASVFRHRMDSLHRHAMMRSVVDDSFDGIATVNQTGQIALFNGSATQIFGVASKEAVGQSIQNLVPHPPELMELLKRGADTNDQIGPSMFGPAELQIKAADGEERVIELVVSLSKLTIARQAEDRRQTQRRMFIYTFRDVTERKRTDTAQREAREQAEAANRAKTEFLANMSHELRTPLNAIIGFSEIMKTEAFGPLGAPQYQEYSEDIHASGWGTQIFGVASKEAVGQSIQNLVPHPPELMELLKRGADTNDQIGPSMFGPAELQIKAADGEERVIELVVSLSKLTIARQAEDRRQTQRRMFIYTFRDVTERKRTDTAQREAREQAEAANRAKTEFLANMSHELRTPLNAIIGFSEIMKTEAFGPLGAPQYQEYSEDIHASGSHLIEIINDILDMSKIEAGELKPIEEVYDFAGIADTCLRLVADRAQKGELKIVSDLPSDLPHLLADPRMIKQILLNLLSNAIKFTPTGGTVSLRAKVEETGFVFSVSDTGIGIPDDKMDAVLEPFGQADMSLHREFEGTGLGLPLVKSMVELHGGLLKIESTMGEGTTATIHLPANRLVREQQIA